ncbi:uncharacterized protein LOC142328874 isoform X2 [Lycorma delicatula]|uniref:uncharacterized protein LOC142328874 isoform X2 n=1 Tax=Lycorma delicatula TaxID=130591 RepID=UPI003F50E22B
MKFSLLIPVLIIYIIKPVENLGFLTGVVKSVLQFPALEDLCNHATAVFVYAESVTQIPKESTLLARKCDDWKDFINGLCEEIYETIILGPDLDTRHSGVFCLRTYSSFNKEIGKGYKGSFGTYFGRFQSDSPSFITQVGQINYQPDEGDEEVVTLLQWKYIQYL